MQKTGSWGLELLLGIGDLDCKYIYMHTYMCMYIIFKNKYIYLNKHIHIYISINLQISKHKKTKRTSIYIYIHIFCVFIYIHILLQLSCIWIKTQIYFFFRYLLSNWTKPTTHLWRHLLEGVPVNEVEIFPTVFAAPHPNLWGKISSVVPIEINSTALSSTTPQ